METKNKENHENEQEENSIDVLDTSRYIRNNPKDFLIDLYRDFGVAGVATYVGGIFLLYRFPSQTDDTKQILFVVSGLVLLALATFISYLRIKSQRERENAIISMAEATCNRLAEQLGKGLTEKQVESIAQKIRQIHRDTRESIFARPIEK